MLDYRSQLFRTGFHFAYDHGFVFVGIVRVDPEHTFHLSIDAVQDAGQVLRVRISGRRVEFASVVEQKGGDFRDKSALQHFRRQRQHGGINGAVHEFLQGLACDLVLSGDRVQLFQDGFFKIRPQSLRHLRDFVQILQSQESSQFIGLETVRRVEMGVHFFRADETLHIRIAEDLVSDFHRVGAVRSVHHLEMHEFGRSAGLGFVALGVNVVGLRLGPVCYLVANLPVCDDLDGRIRQHLRGSLSRHEKRSQDR